MYRKEEDYEKKKNAKDGNNSQMGRQQTEKSFLQVQVKKAEAIEGQVIGIYHSNVMLHTMGFTGKHEKYRKCGKQGAIGISI